MILHLLLLVLFAFPSSALNILVWSPSYGQSHVNFMGNIADTLVGAGHNVTMLIVENDPDVRKTGSRLVRNVIRYSSPLVRSEEWSELHFKQVNIFHLRTFEISDYMKMENINYRICQGMLDDSTFLNGLRLSRFDLAVIEMFHFCPAGISHLAGIPKIVLSSALGMTLAHYEFLGLPITLSNTPAFLTEHGNEMSFVQRVNNVIYHYVQKALLYRMFFSEQALFSRRFSKFPSLLDIYKNKMDYLLLNSNEFTDPVRPVTHSVKFIGGAGIPEPEPLPEDFENILNGAGRGVILFSLGSIVRSGEMPLIMRKAFLEAFGSFPEYEFIWKDDFNANSSLPNVHFRNWLPQVDLLADKRVKVFITHGGLNSIQESIVFGVPMVILPIFADQEGNAALASERGFAVKLSKFGVTKDVIVESLRQVLGKLGEESTFAASAQQASRFLKGSPRRMRAEIERVVHFSGHEQALRHLKVNTNLSFMQYYNLDVYMFMTFVIIGGLLFSARFVFTYNYICDLSFNLKKHE